MAYCSIFDKISKKSQNHRKEQNYYGGLIKLYSIGDFSS